MPDKQKKPKSPKQGATASNLLASMPWLTKKTFLIPALASVLVLSMVGVVLAVQATNSPNADQESSEVSITDVEVDVVAEPVIGPECVEGEPVCEEVKHILLEIKNWEGGVFPWTYEELVESMMYQHNVTREFAVSVINAVEFDWGEDVSASGSSGSAKASSSSIGSACVRGQVICEAAIYVLIESNQGKNFTREDFIEVWMSEYGVAREEVEAIISAVGFTNWAISASSGGSGAGGSVTYTLNPCYSNPAEGRKSLSCAKNEAQSTVQYAMFSRRDVIEALVFQGYSKELATEAVDSLNVDWNLEAQQQARDFVRQGGASRLWLLGVLELELGFTSAEALYGVDSLNLDYLEQATRVVVDVLTRQPCDGNVVGINAMYDHLYNREGFEYEESWSAIESQYDEDDFGWWWLMYPECVVAWDE